ncbi:unnamed protein product [Adineta steineri]|uniref:C2H2-type domain-containing protein n=1 Tax=Adineta steineri TaxID=433720 RepID=A0A820BRJ3_9BILA|nr:unnamed protein product [Adineta steineri]CAF4205747.1 unnamed protein product [Adineta steineri]
MGIDLQTTMTKHFECQFAGCGNRCDQNHGSVGDCHLLRRHIYVRDRSYGVYDVRRDPAVPDGGFGVIDRDGLIVNDVIDGHTGSSNDPRHPTEDGRDPKSVSRVAIDAGLARCQCEECGRRFDLRRKGLEDGDGLHRTDRLYECRKCSHRFCYGCCFK